MTPPAAFRLQSRAVFLTYPRCPLTKEECLEQLQSTFSTWGIQEYIVCEEDHRDGGKHLHAVIKLARKCDVKQATRLDLSKDGTNYHGNYKPVRDWKAAIEYCQKEGNFIADLKPVKKAVNEVYTEALKQPSMPAALAYIKEHAPRDYCLGFSRIKEALEANYPAAAPPAPLLRTRDQFKETRVLTDWVENNLLGMKSFCIKFSF